MLLSSWMQHKMNSSYLHVRHFVEERIVEPELTSAWDNQLLFVFFENRRKTIQ